MIKQFKRPRILIAFAAILFLSSQYLFFYKISDTSNNFQPAQLDLSTKDLQQSNNINIRGRTIIIIPTVASRLITTTTSSHIKISLIKELDIPLNDHKQPYLRSILPFFNTLNLKLKTVEVSLEPIIGDPKKSGIFIRGADLNKISLYMPDKNRQLKCLNSNQIISYKYLNDNYCDCVDGTDEPGTSACQYSKFYCTTQDGLLKDNFIPSSRVDDDICDCCDGSDETSKKCPNVCNKQIAIAKADLNRVQQGLNRKNVYLANGVSQDERRYGPGGVFFLLSKSCFKIDWSEFTFEVCPFNKVIQFKKNSGSSLINLGHISSLELVNKVWRLRITKGDPTNCSHPRTSEINFSCGLTDEILSVQEPEKCLYVFKMSTPAAC